ncbi:MAG: tRNA pseudouridine(38-40) synthase TruA [Wujia sp.]
MNNYVMKIQYDGGRYSGWQKQGNTGNTIQGKLEELLGRLLNEEIEVNGSGRTDAGVHAICQVANFKTSRTLDCHDFLSKINEFLPHDIRVFSLEGADMRFHARLNAVQKHYRYCIDRSEVENVFSRKYALHLPGELDVEAMRKAAALLCGKHDFKSFCDNRHMKKSSVRNIYRIDFTENEGMLTIDYYGDGFLYHMVRIITGTLIMVGQGRLSSESVEDILFCRDRQKAGELAPAHGLFLTDVSY